VAVKTELWLDGKSYATLQMPGFTPAQHDEIVLPHPAEGDLCVRVYLRALHVGETREADVLRLYVEECPL
jgi:hypothetical protein